MLRPEGSRVTLRTDSGSEEIQGSIVSGNFFDLLSVRPLLGRTFSSSEAQRGENVAVLSYGMWKSRFGGTSAILGRSIPIDNRSVSIIGVMPPDFQYPNKQAELWMLLTADPDGLCFKNSGSQMRSTVWHGSSRGGRLRKPERK